MKRILVILILITSCTESKKNNNESNNKSEIYLRIIDSLQTNALYESYNSKQIYKIDSLKNRALKLGDTSAYYQISGYYIFNINEPNELFYISYKMATKYHYSKAYFDLFYILYINKNKEKLDICTYNMAMFYLLLAYENNYEQSKYFVEQIFGNNKIPHSETYKKKFCY